jgi:hypothetical protein
MATLKLNGKEYEVKFTYMAILKLEQHYGKGIGKIFKEIDMENLNTLNTFLWACLKRHSDFNKAGVDDIALLLDEAFEDEELTLDELGKAIEEAVNNSVLVKGKGKQGNGKK